MSFIKDLKNFIKKNPTALYLIESRKRKKYTKLAEEIDDETFIKMLYRKANNGEEPNLENPRKFTEKLQWLKLYYRDDRIPICSDKVEAKKYVSDAGYPELIIPNIGVYDTADKIDENNLPDKFVIKASHGSGWNIICNGNKDKINWKKSKKIMNNWLKQNLYIYGREWNYRYQKPMIIIEKMLESDNIVDYKFMCFNGKVRAMQVNHKIDDKSYVDFYNGNWEKIDGMSCGIYPCSDVVLEKPSAFDEMKIIAEDLAKPFPFVRVDLYYVDGKIFFGEMTFFPGSGFWSISPESRNIEFGSWLELPKKTL